MRFASALGSQKELCPAECDCAYARASGISPNDVVKDTATLHRWRPAGFSNEWECSTMTVRRYLTNVYPTAAERLELTPTADNIRFFDSLHFYYDHGCDGVGRCGTPGVMLRNLYADLLPCRVNLTQPAPHSCLQRYHAFAPSWTSQLMKQGWAEVEHRAFGMPLPKRGKQAPKRESDFMDPGAAGMWYVYRRGSGIFYRMGRTKTAPGKNEMLAALLQEAYGNASHWRSLDASWRSMVTNAVLFDPLWPTSGLWGDADRILSAANGSLTCGELGLRSCRCTIILGDEWDDAMVWLARALHYETLLLQTTRICHRDCSNGLPDCNRIVDFTTAYAELVDLRVLTNRWIGDQALGVHRFLSNNSNISDVHKWRKKASIAERWISQIRSTGLLSLRDPEQLDDDSLARPCNFSVVQRTLRCEGHVSTAWSWAPWWRACGIVMCGHVLGGWVFQPKISHTHSLNQTSTSTAPVEQVKSD